MPTIPPGSIPSGIFILLSIFSGVWVTTRGKPLNVVIVTIHKLISLAAVIFTGVAIYRLNRLVHVNPFGLAAIVLSGLFFISLFGSGAVLSSGKVTKGVLLIAHKSLPLLAAISVVLTFYFMINGK